MSVNFMIINEDDTNHHVSTIFSTLQYPPRIPPAPCPPPPPSLHSRCRWIAKQLHIYMHIIRVEFKCTIYPQCTTYLRMKKNTDLSGECYKYINIMIS